MWKFEGSKPRIAYKINLSLYNMKALYILLLLSYCSLGYSQDRKIDKLEILYSQKHYTKVLRNANKLLAMPDYDYSGMPSFYKSLALFKLVDVEDWYTRHDNAVNEAITNYNTFLTYEKTDAYIKSHYFEIAELKLYLIDLQKILRQKKQHANALKIERFVQQQLKNVNEYGIDRSKPPLVNNKPIKPNKKNNKNATEKPTESKSLSLRERIVAFARKYVGVKYLWAGNSPKGFDCSGYIGYIFKNHGIIMPRSAAGQKENSTKLKVIEAFMGDLVFFKSGSKITHVGLIISKPKEPLTMIHSSSSKGIIITNIDQSTYWKQKLSGAGRVIK